MEKETKSNKIQEEIEMEKETKVSEKTEERKSQKKKVEEIKPKEKAFVNGFGLRISTKSSKAICKMIKGKSIDKSVELLHGVIKGRVPVRMEYQETAHQKSRGMKNISGSKFPKAVAVVFLDLLKQLKANASVNQIEEPIISLAMANIASRPYRRGGIRAKRSHVYIEVKTKLDKNKK